MKWPPRWRHVPYRHTVYISSTGRIKFKMDILQKKIKIGTEHDVIQLTP